MSNQATIREEELKNRMNKFLSILAVFAAVNAAAVGFHVGALPDPAFIDTESATNICFAAVSRGMSCDFMATIALEGTATNCYQLTFGMDTDGNGSLSPEESDFSLGWRAGRWFTGRPDISERVFALPSQSSGSRTLSLALHAHSDGRLSRVQILADGAPLFPELAVERPDWLFSRDWNMVEIVRRGDGPSSGWCELAREDFGFRVMLR